MRKYRKSLAAIFLGGFALGASACAKLPENPVEITVIHGWGSTEKDHEIMREIYRGFQEENPDITLQLLSMPTTDEVMRKVEDMLMVGQIPDVLFLGGEGRDSVYRYMVENDLALDLMPYVEADEEFLADLSPANLTYWKTEEGQLYTVSDVLHLSGGYWYNRDIFREAGILEPPKTWEGFCEAFEKIRGWSEETGNGVQILQVRAEGYLYLMDYLMSQNRGQAQEAIENHHIKVTEEEMGEILDRLSELESYSPIESQQYSYRDENSLFNEGKLALYINGVWGASMIDDGINAGYALFPAEKGKTVACESACLGYVAGNHKDETRAGASVEFIKYMMSDEVQERILLETKQMPANPAVAPKDYPETSGRFSQAVDEVRSADVRIEVPDNLWENDAMQIFERNILDVLSGTMNRQTFIDLLR